MSGQVPPSNSDTIGQLLADQQEKLSNLDSALQVAKSVQEVIWLKEQKRAVEAFIRQLQEAISKPSSGHLPVVNTSSAAYQSFKAPPSVGLSAAQIAQQNAVIERLEKDWMKMYKEKQDEKDLRAQIAKIREHMRLYPGTFSKYVDEFERIVNGWVISEELQALISMIEGGARKKKRKGKGKTKKQTKRRKSKKSRRHRSK